MKIKLFTAFLFVSALFFTTALFGQCTPADSISCPDPENNGEVCPDSLDVAYQGQYYEQVFSLLPPQETSGVVLPIHHLHLSDVGNLPEGISWVSNTEDNDFYPGNYYCVLMSGTPADTGTYSLHITVDVFGELNGTPVYLITVVDSTSLSLTVEPYNGIGDLFNKNHKLKVRPNPFNRHLTLWYRSPQPDNISIELHTLSGKLLMTEQFEAVQGDNRFVLPAETFPAGHYVVVLVTSDGKRMSDIAIKTK